MTYERINFVDQSVERPRTYEMTHNSDGSVTLVDSFGLVDELGTPINADTMNHIEDGIVNNDNRITYLEDRQIVDYKIQNMLTTGSVSTDEQGYNQLEDMYHSTFDLSKFEVVGSPTISDDGIVSGFSSNNYLMLDVSVVSKLLVGDFKFHFKFKTMETVSGALILGGGDELGGTFSLWISNSQVAPIIYLDNNGTVQRSPLGNIENANIISANTEYECYFSNKGNNYGFGIKKVGDSNYITSKGLDSSYSICAKTQLICKSNGKFSIPLGSMSIMSNGYPVFNGNKNGLDIIKPDNYSVVGTPTITDDGVASGFSVNNYLNVSDFIINSKTWEIKCKFNTNDFSAGQSVFGFSNSYWANTCVITSSKNIQFYLAVGSNSMVVKNLGTNKCYISAGVDNYLYIKFDGNKYEIGISQDGINYNTDSYISSEPLYIHNSSTNRYIQLGKYGGQANTPFLGSIDLNAFKIYVDGNLVYQPCLKIPYTESKTGSKVVDATYRDRVEDVYNQYGTEYLYYTIDEENKNFTLPMGEIYGMIENAKTNRTIGEIIQVSASSDYVPEGCLPCDGTEYSKSQFGLLWSNYLIGKEVFDPESITIVGSPTITDDGVVSGFSGENYLQTPTIIDFAKANSWILETSFTTPNAFTADNSIYSGDISYNGIRHTINSTGKLSVAFSSVSTGYDIGIITGSQLLPNTRYFSKVIFDGSKYSLYLSKDGINYFEDGTPIQNNLKVMSAVGKIGVNNNNNTPFMGSIDLKDLSITIDGQTVFDCVKNQPLLNTCTYQEYETDIVTYGQCAKFAVDTINGKFRVPTIIGKLVTGINKADVLYDMQTTKATKLRVPLADSLGRYNMLFNAKPSSDNTEGLTSANNSSNYGQIRYTGTSYSTSDLPSGGTTGSVTPNIVNLDPNGTLYVNNEDLEQSIEVRYFVVVANGEINRSMMNWSEWASNLQVKANTDLSNVEPSQSFIDTSIRWGMPDYSAGIEVSFPVETAKFTAPTDGLYITNLTASNKFSYLYINGLQSSIYRGDATGGESFDNFIIPLSKGDVIYWDNVLTATTSTFYPLKGAK